MKFDADLSPSTGYILSQNIVVKCKTWESILLTQLTLEYVNVLTTHTWRIGGNWRWPIYALCYISLSSSGLIPGRVKVRCRPGEGQEGQSQVCVMSRFKYKLKDFDLSYTLFRNIFLCPLPLSFHLPAGMETLTVHNMSDLTLSLLSCKSLYKSVQVCTSLYKFVQRFPEVRRHYMSLHAVPWAFIQVHKLHVVTKVCMQLHKLACSHISLHSVT